MGASFLSDSRNEEIFFKRKSCNSLYNKNSQMDRESSLSRALCASCVCFRDSGVDCSCGGCRAQSSWLCAGWVPLVSSQTGTASVPFLHTQLQELLPHALADTWANQEGMHPKGRK